MFLAEPPPTRYDFRFRLFGVPVRVHPLFWLISLILGVGLQEPKLVLIWIGAVFVSILVHEFGHVLAFRRYGLRSRVVLHALGGLAIADTGYSDSFGWSPRRAGVAGAMPEGWAQVVISLGGPLAGFAFAAVIAALLYVAGVKSAFLGGMSIGRGDYIPFENLHDLVFFLLWINIFWGLANLLPIYPLDGGQIARELFIMADARRGVVRSLKLSIVTAVLAGIAGLLWGNEKTSWYTALFCIGLAVNSYQILQAYQSYGGDRGW